MRGRQLLARLGLPEPWQGTIEASLRLIDELEREIGECECELRRVGADHRYIPLLCTVPGISWVLAYTIAAEIGDINRFPRRLARARAVRRESIGSRLALPNRDEPLPERPARSPTPAEGGSSHGRAA